MATTSFWSFGAKLCGHDPAPASAIEEAQSVFRPREAAGNKQGCGFFKTFEEAQLPIGGGRERRGEGRGGEGAGMTEWQLLRRGSSHLLKRASTSSTTEPRCARTCSSAPRRPGQRPTLASLALVGFCLFDETSLRARSCPLRARRVCQNKANKAQPAVVQK